MTTYLRPYSVQRYDQEDGSISYEIWDKRPESYRRLCTIHEDPVDEDVPTPERWIARLDAELIVKALNTYEQQKLRGK